jgi:alkyl sulfatase BDS1-like metallo-beta-lactamase superfamily hydrolase
VEQTLALMNGGARLDEVIHGVVPPARLMERPYLQPVYDEPEFIVRTVWRLYGGWWDGNPATLKPAPERSLALELAELAGGAAALADRALALMEEGGAAEAGNAAAEAGNAGDGALRLAGHLAELAWLAAPDDRGVQEVRRAVFTRRADKASSTMAHGVFSWAARESSAPPDPPPPGPRR